MGRFLAIVIVLVLVALLLNLYLGQEKGADAPEKPSVDPVASGAAAVEGPAPEKSAGAETGSEGATASPPRPPPRPLHKKQ